MAIIAIIFPHQVVRMVRNF